MSITDELREWIASLYTPNSGTVKMEGERIADHIDAAHRSALEKLAAQVDESERSGFDQGFASADDWLAQNEDAMAEHGWVRLPVDADGVPIHVGERVQIFGNDQGTVSHMSLADDGWRVYVKYDGGNGTGSGEPKRIRHHHTPTVEDVLREFAREIDADAYGITDAKVAEFAAKLRLAGEGE